MQGNVPDQDQTSGSYRRDDKQNNNNFGMTKDNTKTEREQEIQTPRTQVKHVFNIQSARTN